MSTVVSEAVSSRSPEGIEQPSLEPFTPEEGLILRHYRQLDDNEQRFIRRAIEAMVIRKEGH